MEFRLHRENNYDIVVIKEWEQIVDCWWLSYIRQKYWERIFNELIINLKIKIETNESEKKL